MEMKKAFIFLGGLIAGVVIKNKCEEYIKNEIEEPILDVEDVESEETSEE